MKLFGCEKGLKAEAEKVLFITLLNLSIKIFNFNQKKKIKMKVFSVIATVLVLSAINVVFGAPQLSGCGPNGCYNVNNNGQGVGCGPNGCGFFGGQSNYQSSSNGYGQQNSNSQRPGVACGPSGCGPVRNNGFGIGCGPNGCGPLAPY